MNVGADISQPQGWAGAPLWTLGRCGGFALSTAAGWLEFRVNGMQAAPLIKLRHPTADRGPRNRTDGAGRHSVAGPDPNP